jgi:hypothetical protein
MVNRRCMRAAPRQTIGEEFRAHESESFRHAAIALAADMELQHCVRRAVRSRCRPLRGALVTAGLIGVVPLADAASFPAHLSTREPLPCRRRRRQRGFVLTGVDAV